MNGANQSLGEALKLGQEALGGQAPAAGGVSIDVASWLTETLNQWKLKMLVTGVGIVILVIIMNVQFFLANLVGVKIPKFLPEMPWWEVMILGLADLAVALLVLVIVTVPLLITSIGCSMPVLEWFTC